ncbi:hypothetical protein BDN67DRAFT_325891 [Paxillus ammoniavirescens]|nr:hypothetical protein BDN67DRAFT_325891 [Paxillus ammoniavirescens]
MTRCGHGELTAFTSVQHTFVQAAAVLAMASSARMKGVRRMNVELLVSYASPPKALPVSVEKNYMTCNGLGPPRVRHHPNKPLARSYDASGRLKGAWTKFITQDTLPTARVPPHLVASI